MVAGILWFIGVFFGAQFASLPFAFAFGEKSGQFYTAAFVFGGAAEAGFAIIAVNYTVRRYGGGWQRLGVRPIDRRALLWAGGAFISALAVSSIYSLIINALDLHFLQSACDEQIPTGIRDNRALLALAAFVVIAFAPLCEELLFRGFVFPGLARAWGVPLGVFASAAIFGSAHLLPSVIMPITAVGMVFAYTYWRSKNIVSVILAHLAFNSLSIAFIAGTTCNPSATGALVPAWWPL